jgi:hypothetical protein
MRMRTVFLVPWIFLAAGCVSVQTSLTDDEARYEPVGVKSVKFYECQEHIPDSCVVIAHLTADGGYCEYKIRKALAKTAAKLGANRVFIDSGIEDGAEQCNASNYFDKKPKKLVRAFALLVQETKTEDPK